MKDDVRAPCDNLPTILDPALRIGPDLAARCLAIVNVMLLALDTRGRVTLINPYGLDTLGYVREEDVLGKDWFEHCVPRAVRAQVRDVFARVMRGEGGSAAHYENPIIRRDGQERIIAWHNGVLRDPKGRITGVLCSGQDVTGTRHAAAALKAREHQQAAVAMLGQQALGSRDFQSLLNAAVTAGAEVLGVAYCKVLERLPGGEDFRLRAGVGWRPGLVGRAVVPGRFSQAGYTLASKAPVIVEDLLAERRFQGPTLLFEHGVVSGLSCAIAGPGGEPWGVLGAHARERRTFTRDDMNFLVAVANILAAVIARRAASQALQEREASLRRAQAIGHIGSWRLDVRRNALTWSEENHRIFGVPAGTPMTYEGFLAIVHPDDRAYVDRMWQEGLRGKPYDIEHRIVVRGTVKWVRERAELEFAEDGALLGGFGTTQDITERKHAEEALRANEETLRRSERFHRQTLESIPGLVFTTRPDGWCDYLSRQWENYTGLPVAEHLGHAWTALLHLADREPAFAAWRKCVADETPYDMEYRVCRRDAVDEWFRVIGEPIRNRNGEIARWFGVAINIQALKEAEATLREADRRKDEFLATLAHELRNPLAPLRSACDILKLAEAPDPTVQAARDIIDRQVSHIVRLVDDLLDVSRITRGKLHIRKERVALCKVLERAVEVARPLIDHAGQVLNISRPAEPIHLDGDPVRLAQVFSNLLNNACKYTPSGGRIDLVVEPAGGEVIVKVADSGSGIPPEHLPHLFEMFHQAPAGPEQVQSGLGIGLSLVEGLVRMHGGRVAASSAGPGQGSSFTVWLPVEQESPRLDAAPAEHSEPRAPGTSARILVVDDDQDVAASLALVLRLHGHAVQTACDGLEALEVAERFRPELVLLDLDIPRLDGYGTCRRLRELPGGKELKVVALTGWSQESNRDKTKAAGFDAHWTKPVAAAAVLDFLANARAGGA